MRIKTSALQPRWILVVGFFIAGAFIGGLTLFLALNIEFPTLQKIHIQNSKGQYTNPLLATNLQSETQFGQHRVLRLKLNGFLKSAQSRRFITDASIYFRDIEPGLWVNINGDGKFSPGKLLKIPIMIVYFKLAAADPSILDQQLTYYNGFAGRSSVSENLFSVKEKLENGKPYTVNELIRSMIVFSDDAAANLLFDNLDKNSLNEVFSDLGIDFKEDKETTDFISLKTYELFFRVLYNATYLSREYSEQALKLFVESDNSIGLGASLPKDIPIANRYGGRHIKNSGDSTKLEIYDCGIVYYPSHPYILCAIVQGDNLENMKRFLYDLGAITFQEVDYDYKT